MRKPRGEGAYACRRRREREMSCLDSRKLASADTSLWKILHGVKVFIIFNSYGFGELEDCTSIGTGLWFVHVLHLYIYIYMKFPAVQNCLFADLIFSNYCLHGFVISNSYMFC